MFRRLLDRLTAAGVPEAPPERPAPEAPAVPEVIDVIDALKASMRAGVQNITEERAVVPGHYVVLLHPDAYDALAPLFEVAWESVTDKLSEEVGRLRHLPYAPRGARPPVAHSPVSVREVFPLDYAWSVQFCPTRSLEDGSDAPIDYVGVATRLKKPGDEHGVAGGDPARMTRRGTAPGEYETHFVSDANLSGDGSREGATFRSPYRAHREPPRSATAAFYVTYVHPDTKESCRFDLAQNDTLVTAEDPDNYGYCLRLDVRYAVSRPHARLRVDPASGTVAVMDMGSSYGTTVNGHKVPPSKPFDGVERWEPVPVGAEIGLGNYVFLTLHAA